MGLWRAHTPAISCLLEACHLCGVDSTLIESGSKRLTVDVKALKQTDSGDGSEASLRRVDGALLSNGGIFFYGACGDCSSISPPLLLFPSPFLFPSATFPFPHLSYSHLLFFLPFLPSTPSPFLPSLPSFPLFLIPPLSLLPTFLDLF